MSTMQLLPQVPVSIPGIPMVSFPAPKKSSGIRNAHKEECGQGENRHRRLEGTEYH